MVIPTHLFAIFRTMMPLLFCTGNFAADTLERWNDQEPRRPPFRPKPLVGCQFSKQRKPTY